MKAQSVLYNNTILLNWENERWKNKHALKKTFEVQKVPHPKFRGIGHHVVSYFFGIKGVELLKKNQKRMKQGG